MSYQNIYQLLISINIHTIRSSRRPIKTTGLFLDIFRWNSINWTTFVLHVIRTFYQWKVTDIVSRVQNFNTFSIIPENLNVLSWIVLEELTGQNDLLKITKSAIFQTGSDVSKIRLKIFYSRTIPISWKSIHAFGRNRVRKIIITRNTSTHENWKSSKIWQLPV